MKHTKIKLPSLNTLTSYRNRIDVCDEFSGSVLTLRQNATNEKLIFFIKLRDGKIVFKYNVGKTLKDIDRGKEFKLSVKQSKIFNKYIKDNTINFDKKVFNNYISKFYSDMNRQIGYEGLMGVYSVRHIWINEKLRDVKKLSIDDKIALAETMHHSIDMSKAYITSQLKELKKSKNKK